MVEHVKIGWHQVFGSNSCEGLSLQLNLAKFQIRRVITKLMNRRQVEKHSLDYVSEVLSVLFKWLDTLQIVAVDVQWKTAFFVKVQFF